MACSFEKTPRGSVLIIGAGVAGLACARELQAAGLTVQVVDKARGVGGRVATRRQDGLVFDHGAQYFTVRDPGFATQVAAWRAEGLAQPWTGRIGVLDRGEVTSTKGATERWVGTPSMSAIGRRLATTVPVQLETRAVSVTHDTKSWNVHFDSLTPRTAETLVLAMPAPQAAALLPPSAPLCKDVMKVKMAPCWTLMADFENRVRLDLDGAFVNNSPLDWAARDSAKPGRPPGERWVLHAGAEWSQNHLELDPNDIAHRLLDAFSTAIGQSLPDASRVIGHRWRFAHAAAPLTCDYLYDAASGLGMCGDWCAGERIEGAFVSGSRLAQQIIRSRDRSRSRDSA